METKAISPKWHGLIDYALAGSLIAIPPLLKANKAARHIYLAEALALLGYVALTDHPTAVKPLIPFTTHGRIDPFNVGQFALQSLLKPFKRQKKVLIFNTVFTAIALAEVLLTNWHGPTKNHPA